MGLFDKILNRTKKPELRVIDPQAIGRDKITDVGRLYYISLHNKDLQRLCGDITGEDLAYFLQAMGLVEVVQGEDETGKIRKYVITRDGFKLNTGSIRNSVLGAIDKIKILFRDKELHRIADALSYLDTSEVRK